MPSKSCLAVLVTALVAAAASCADFHRGPAPLAGGTDAAQVADSMFEKLVYPILESNCKECHAAGREASASKLVLTGNFFLDRFEVVALVIPGNPTGSELLIQQTLDTHPGGQRLAPDSLEYQTVALWIQGLDSTAR
jgi:hypothetical protein